MKAVGNCTAPEREEYHGDGGGQRRAEARGGHHRALVHAGGLPEKLSRQDRRLQEDDVRHRQERRQPGQQFRLDVRTVLGEFEEAVQHRRSPAAGRSGLPARLPDAMSLCIDTSSNLHCFAACWRSVSGVISLPDSRIR